MNTNYPQLALKIPFCCNYLHKWEIVGFLFLQDDVSTVSGTEKRDTNGLKSHLQRTKQHNETTVELLETRVVEKGYEDSFQMTLSHQYFEMFYVFSKYHLFTHGKAKIDS